jgi:hypothetical protein
MEPQRRPAADRAASLPTTRPPGVTAVAARRGDPCDILVNDAQSLKEGSILAPFATVQLVARTGPPASP